MNTTLTALIVFGCLVGAVLLGRALRRLLPEDHLTADSRDTIKLAMGLVATMAALVLGLLVSSVKGSYDTERSEVIQMAAKVAFLDRVLAIYGPEAAEARARFHEAVKEAVGQMWPGEASWIGAAGSQPASRQRSLCRRSGSVATRRHAAQAQGPGHDDCHRSRTASVVTGSAIGSVNFNPDADHPCLLASGHFPRLQRAGAAQSYCHLRFDGFGPRCLWRHFLDLGVGPAL